MPSHRRGFVRRVLRRAAAPLRLTTGSRRVGTSSHIYRLGQGDRHTVLEIARVGPHGPDPNAVYSEVASNTAKARIRVGMTKTQIL
jgi:hypothetical protein